MKPRSKYYCESSIPQRSIYLFHSKETFVVLSLLFQSSADWERKPLGSFAIFLVHKLQSSHGCKVHCVLVYCIVALPAYNINMPIVLPLKTKSEGALHMPEIHGQKAKPGHR